MVNQLWSGDPHAFSPAGEMTGCWQLMVARVAMGNA
jgi:hypothetical protein